MTDSSWVLVFCEGCGELLGVMDHLRIRSEHNDLAGHRGQRFVRVVPVAEGSEALVGLLNDNEKEQG